MGEARIIFMKVFMILHMQRFTMWISRYYSKCSQRGILETARLTPKCMELNKQVLGNNFVHN